MHVANSGQFLIVLLLLLYDTGRCSIYHSAQLFIRSKSDGLTVALFKYFLHKIRETILHRKYRSQQKHVAQTLATCLSRDMSDISVTPRTRTWSLGAAVSVNSKPQGRTNAPQQSLTVT